MKQLSGIPEDENNLFSGMPDDAGSPPRSSSLLAHGIGAILGRGADYVMTVTNMPTLYQQLKKLPWASILSASSVSTDHGRSARRTIKLAPAWTGFASAAQLRHRRGQYSGSL
ncbi:MAG: hypothetical protein ABSA93_17525 [Streptosporangiaceae bacterium]